ncbi:MAG: pilus assembly protein PilM [Planctomycetota bacterium]
MTTKWWRPNHCPIGIDLGKTSVKLMQLERIGDGLRVIASAAVTLPDGLDPYSDKYHDAVGDAIKQGLSRGAFRGKGCVSSMPSAVMQYKNLRLPAMPEAELASAVQWEAADRVRYPGQSPVVQFFDAGEVRQGTDIRREVILVAAPNGFIEKHTATLQAIGLSPQAIDAAPAALARCLNESGQIARQGQSLIDSSGQDTADPSEPLALPAGNEPTAPPVQVILEFGYSSSNIVIASGGSVVFFKPLPIGSGSLDQAAAEAMRRPIEEVAIIRRAEEQEGKTATEQAAEYAEFVEATQTQVNDLGREIGLCLRYYTVTFRGARPETVSLIGGAGDQALADRLTPLAGVTIKPSDPLSGIDITSVRGAVPRSTHAAWGLAAGLSLRDECSSQKTKGAA